jgi:hypothetical protein
MLMCSAMQAHLSIYQSCRNLAFMLVRTKLLRWLPADAVALPCAFGLPLAVIPDHCTSGARRLVGSWPAALFPAAVPFATEGAARFLYQ